MTNKTQQKPDVLDHIIWIKQLTQTRVLCDLALQGLTEVSCVLEYHKNETVHFQALKALSGFADTLGDLSDVARKLEKTVLKKKESIPE